MTLRTIVIFLNEIYSKGPKQNYITNKIDVYHIDATWFLDILDSKDYGPKKKTGYRYILVKLDNFSNFARTLALKNQNAQLIEHSFETFPIVLNGKPNLIETVDAKAFVNRTSTDFLNKNNIKRYGSYTFLGVVFGERFNRTIRNFLKRPVLKNDIIGTIYNKQ